MSTQPTVHGFRLSPEVHDRLDRLVRLHSARDGVRYSRAELVAVLINREYEKVPPDAGTPTAPGPTTPRGLNLDEATLAGLKALAAAFSRERGVKCPQADVLRVCAAEVSSADLPPLSPAADSPSRNAVFKLEDDVFDRLGRAAAARDLSRSKLVRAWVAHKLREKGLAPEKTGDTTSPPVTLT